MKRWLFISSLLIMILLVGGLGQYALHNWIDLILNMGIVTLLFQLLIRNVEMQGIWESTLGFLFFCYLVFVHIMVTWLYVDQYVLGLEFHISLRQVNVIPFETLGNVYAMTELPHLYWKQFIGNLLLLTPLGYLILRLRIVRGAWRALWFVFLFTLGIECVQFIKSIFIVGGRSTDIDDVILNTLGGLIGIVVHLVIQQIQTVMKKSTSSYVEKSN